MEIITTAQLKNEKWVVLRTSDENDLVSFVDGKVFETEKEADTYRRNMFPQSKKYGSKELIGNFEERFTELENKQFDRRSFYNGWKEGRAELLKELKRV